jgi:hypothetical protein
VTPISRERSRRFAEQCSVKVDIAKLNVKEGDLSKAIVWRPPRMSPSGQTEKNSV